MSAEVKILIIIDIRLYELFWPWSTAPGAMEFTCFVETKDVYFAFIYVSWWKLKKFLIVR